MLHGSWYYDSPEAYKNLMATGRFEARTGEDKIILPEMWEYLVKPGQLFKILFGIRELHHLGYNWETEATAGQLS